MPEFISPTPEQEGKRPAKGILGSLALLFSIERSPIKNLFNPKSDHRFIETLLSSFISVNKRRKNS